MVVATRLDSSIPPTLTFQSFYDGVKQAFANAGFPAPFDEYVVGTTEKIVVYAIVLDATKTYGTTYLRVRVISNFTSAQQLYSTWNATTHTGTSPSTEVAYTAFATNQQINFISLNGSNEYKLILAYQGTIYFPFGFIAPVNKPIWWELNSWNYCFIPLNNNYAVLRSSALNPFGNSENDVSYINYTRLANANPVTNRRDLLSGTILHNQTNNGIAGKTSDDFVVFYGTGTTRFDVIQVPNSSNQYIVLYNAAGGLAVRFQ